MHETSGYEVLTPCLASQTSRLSALPSVPKHLHDLCPNHCVMSSACRLLLFLAEPLLVLDRFTRSFLPPTFASRLE